MPLPLLQMDMTVIFQPQECDEDNGQAGEGKDAGDLYPEDLPDRIVIRILELFGPGDDAGGIPGNIDPEDQCNNETAELINAFTLFRSFQCDHHQIAPLCDLPEREIGREEEDDGREE